MRVKYLRYVILSFVFFSMFAHSSDAQSLLTKMREKMRTSNYEAIYIYDDFMSNETLLYRHFLSQDGKYAQLLYMDGPPREILQNNDKIGYFQEEKAPFSLPGKRIVEAFPSIIYGDFSKLSQYYNFIPAGRARISNHLCQIIRVVDKSDSRYSHIIWIDEDNYFPLRIDLVDQNGGVLEQFKVIFYKQYDDFNFALDAIKNMKFPPILASSVEKQSDFSWKVNWLPVGFKETSHYSRQLDDNLIETRLFSDDVFNFSVNISPLKNKVKKQSLRQGTKVIHVTSTDTMEIVVIGELPESTAKHIADNISFEKN